MKSAPPESSDLVNRLRQQLILAQVRIMELEDTRDRLTPRVAELEQLLRSAQTLADQKMDEAAHLGKVLTDAQARGEHLHQLVVQANQEHASTQGSLADVQTKLAQAHANISHLETKLQATAAEVRALKSSRSWRWTAWLRTLGGQSPDPRA